jgi:hypothetical protein
MVSLDVEGDIRQHKYLEALSMKEWAAPTGMLRSFGSVTSRGTVAKYLREEEKIGLTGRGDAGGNSKSG